jgi:hypothetical protein
VVIRCPSGDHNGLLDDARLFVEVIINGKRAKRTEQLVKESESTGLSWRLNENIEM